jgi:hydrogenase maturation protein HypF
MLSPMPAGTAARKLNWDRQGRNLFSKDPIAEAAAEARGGTVVAIKGLGGFHLAVDATNPAAVALLRERKCRVEKPFAIMVPSGRSNH